MATLADSVACGIKPIQHRSLKSQLIRSANSVPANIVEAAGQESSKDFVRFLRYAVNSANEAEYHNFAARDRGLVSSEKSEELERKIEEVRKMLYGLIRYLREHP